MHRTTTTPTPGRRLALLPVEEKRTDRPVIRRYKLARVLDDFGAAVAAPSAIATGAPARGVRAP
jgi:hypothetical protein